MNSRTAETLLRCYRPGKAADARLEKAVRFAQDDPELRKSLSEQISFDEQIVDAIHFIKPPEDFRQKLNHLGIKPGSGKTRLRSQVINPAVITAIFGGIVILGIAVFFVMDRAEKFPGREEVENMLDAAGKMTGSEMETVSSTAGQLGDWFYIHGYDGFEAPAGFAALPVVGSRVFRLDDRTVAQVAVNSNAQPFLVFEFHASEFGVQLPSEGDWKVLTQNDWVGAIRQRGDHCYLVTFRGAKPDMHALLKSLPSK